MISARQIPRGTSRVRTVSFAAPVGGWNARDSIGDMDKLDAVTLTNFFPGTTSVQLRQGYTQFATGFDGQVETLMNYTPGSGTQTLFAASGTKIYDATAGGNILANVSLTLLTNARWQYVNYTTAGGTYLMMVNGADRLRIWNGTAWFKDTDGAPYDITNVTTTNVNNIAVFKNRIWLVEKNTLKAWYLPINAIGGAATALDHSSICEQGGHLVAAMTWTLDAGYGIDDHLVFITSNGEVVVWRLTDPTTPTGIAMIGLFQIGSPVGQRCYVKYAGDLLLITQDGVVPLSAALQSSRLNPRISITDKIQDAMSTAVTNYGSNFGWQLFPFPKASQLYLNVPVTEGSAQQQYVQNNITRAWCNFTGWEANCWEMLNDNAYFGANGFVGKAWTTNTDNGAAIDGTALQAFQQFGPGQKQCSLVRFHLLTDGTGSTLSLYGNVNADYDTSYNSGTLLTETLSNNVWDTGQWDVASWSESLAPVASWQNSTALGYSLAPFLRNLASTVGVRWVATDLVFQPGGIF